MHYSMRATEWSDCELSSLILIRPSVSSMAHSSEKADSVTDVIFSLVFLVIFLTALDY